MTESPDGLTILLLAVWIAAALGMLGSGVWLLRRRLIRGWTWRRLARIGIAIWAVAVWAVLASIVALVLSGQPLMIGQLWWWDFLPWIGDPAVLSVVLESAVAAAAIVGAALGIRLLARGQRRSRAEKTLYGKTEWASRDDLGRGGFDVFRRGK
jgi:hypothetical protein